MTDIGRTANKAGRTAATLDRAVGWVLQATLPLALSALFLWDGLTHYVLDWSTSVAHMRDVGLYPPQTLCALAGAFVIVGALALLVPASRRIGALTLAVYAGLAAVSPHGVLSLSAGLGIEPRGAADVALVAVLLLVAARGREPETA